MKIKICLFIGILIVSLLTACQFGGQGSDRAVLSSTHTLAPPPETPIPTQTLIPSPTIPPTATPIVILDPGPIKLEVETGDGVWLDGLYYPADQNPAPVIVLMHWARGDQSEWEQVAQWLQGRGLLEPVPDYNKSWKSSNWYPDRTQNQSLGVVTFTFRDCEENCKSFLPVEWLKDIEAVLLATTNLQGVDPDQILTAGASIGADGAVYGCSWLNRSGSGSCLGSFLLSPASLLTIAFEKSADDLLKQEPALPVYCLIGLRDDASVETCLDYPGLTLVDYGYIDNHGLELLQPDVGENPLNLLQEFISAALGSE